MTDPKVLDDHLIMTSLYQRCPNLINATKDPSSTDPNLNKIFIRLHSLVGLNLNEWAILIWSGIAVSRGDGKVA